VIIFNGCAQTGAVRHRAPLKRTGYRRTRSTANRSALRKRWRSKIHWTLRHRPLSAPYLSADTTGEGALAGQVGGTLAIDAAGTGVGPAARSTPASDQYGSIYLDGAAGSSAVAQVTVSWREGTVAGDKSGLMMRNDMTGGGSPVGVALYVTGPNTIAMIYSTSGGPTYSTTLPTAAGTTVTGASITLKLVRSGSTYSGYWSSDGGATFMMLGSGGVTVANQAAATPQDVGMFHTSGAAGGPTETQFTGFTAS
jgi:alpha-galactosidase